MMGGGGGLRDFFDNFIKLDFFIIIYMLIDFFLMGGCVLYMYVLKVFYILFNLFYDMFVL